MSATPKTLASETTLSSDETLSKGVEGLERNRDQLRATRRFKLGFEPRTARKSEIPQKDRHGETVIDPERTLVGRLEKEEKGVKDRNVRKVGGKHEGRFECLRSLPDKYSREKKKTKGR